MNKFFIIARYFFSTMLENITTKFFTGLLVVFTFIMTVIILAYLYNLFGAYSLLGILLVALIPYLVGHVITVIKEKHYIKQRIKAAENRQRPPQPPDYYF